MEDPGDSLAYRGSYKKVPFRGPLPPISIPCFKPGFVSKKPAPRQSGAPKLHLNPADDFKEPGSQSAAPLHSAQAEQRQVPRGSGPSAPGPALPASAGLLLRQRRVPDACHQHPSTGAGPGRTQHRGRKDRHPPSDATREIQPLQGHSKLHELRCAQDRAWGQRSDRHH